jgi:hypothetical protein
LLAQRLGAGASVLGIDISGPMLEVAADKIARTDDSTASLGFLQADAADHPFEAGSFDLLLAFSCWQPLAANDWTRIPLQAALQYVELPAPPDPNAPGPFAFANPDRVRQILGDAGFANINIESHNREIRFGEAPTLGESVRQLAEIGPVGRLLMDQDQDTKEKVFSAMEVVLAPYYRDGALLMSGAIWFVTAEVA